MGNFLKSKGFTILSIFTICFLGFLVFKNKPIIESLNNEINELEGRIAGSDEKTEKLQSEFEYFESNSYLDRQARLKLNLKDPGENVAYIVRDEEKIASDSEDIEKKDFLNNLINRIFKRD